MVVFIVLGYFCPLTFLLLSQRHYLSAPLSPLVPLPLGHPSLENLLCLQGPLTLGLPSELCIWRLWSSALIVPAATVYLTLKKGLKV